jgi:D-methionine transport system ATP-binding protein
VAILEHGTVVEEGEVSEVFSHPKAAATRALVFPGAMEGESLASSGYGQLVRLVFQGSVTTNKPLIASMAMDCGIAANILGASTRTVGKREYGYMLIEIPGGPDELAKALKYISGVDNVAVQVEAQYNGKGA